MKDQIIGVLAMTFFLSVLSHLGYFNFPWQLFAIVPISSIAALWLAAKICKWLDRLG